MPKQDAKEESVVERLTQARGHSDAGSYTRKHIVMRQLLAEVPEDFVVDTDDEHNPGITHTPSGFKMHVPRHLAAMARGGEKRADVVEARKDTDTNPSENQIEAGNYAHGKFRWQGLVISLENPKGSTRSGTSKSGKFWSTTMKHDYGRFLGTTGADKDHVDVFIGPDTDSEIVFVVDQVDPESGKFDEHKILAAFPTEAEARKGYLDNYEKDWKGLGDITAMTVDQLKWWLAEGDQRKPLRGQQIKLSFELLCAVLGEELRDGREKQAAAARVGLDTAIGATSGGLLGALLGAMRAKARNKAIAEGREQGQEQSVALSALGYGAGGALLGAGAGAALNLLRKPDDNRPFFDQGRARRQMRIPDWDKNKGDKQLDPEDYMRHWYKHVDGGWDRVKARSADAVGRAQGDRAVADPGSRGRALDLTTTNDRAGHLTDLNPGPSANPGMRVVGGQLPGDTDKPFHYGVRYSDTILGKYLARLTNQINGFPGKDRELPSRDARNILAGHEARHQFQGPEAVGYKSPVKEFGIRTYGSVGPELTQALGQLKAETAFLTGKLIRSAKDFRQLLDETGVTDPDPHKLKKMEQQYTPEGARMLNYMRTIRTQDKEAYELLIDELDKRQVYDQVAAFSDNQGDTTKMASASDTGPEAIAMALQGMDLDEMEREQRAILAKGAKTKRGHAVRVLGIIQGLRRNEIQPHELMISKVPLLPPAFRPFNVVGQTFVPGDANELYKDLDSYRKSYHQMRSELGDEGSRESWKDLRQAVKAVYGHADSPNPKTASRGVSGFLQAITGSTGKYGWVNRKLLSKPQDSVARATIIPDPELTMDQVGIPEDAAWPAYGSHVQRRMVKGGMAPIDALRHIKERSASARKALELEMLERPVLLSRAPAWHKFNIVGSWSRLVKGDAIRISPLIATGLNADYDGDQMNMHVPASREAVREAADTLMPSQMPFSIRNQDKIVPALKHEQILGLYDAQNTPSKKTWKFASRTDALAAIRSGTVPLEDEIEVPDQDL